MSNGKIGDFIRYNGNLGTNLLEYEKYFIETNMTFGRLYNILDTGIDFYHSNILCFKVICDNNLQFWIPAVCFDLVNIRDVYNLR